VAPADGGEEAVRRDVQKRVERTSEPVPQHCVARAMPTGVAHDQVRRRQDRCDETDARVDVFLGPFLAGAGPGTQEELVPEALRRANVYVEAGVDCVYPIALWETDALRRFTSEVRGPVNVVRVPQGPSLSELAALGVARVSWGPFLYRDAMARFEDQLASLQE
jgi:hypothetical protein